jgi:tetratricopeptide (TPR) repeat protein
LIVVALAAIPRVATATPGQELAQANAAFRSGQFTAAQPLYNDLLYPTPRLASKDDLADAYVALGVCRLESGDVPGAKREFEKALNADPYHQLAKDMITNQEAIRIFEETKLERAQREKEQEAKRKQADLEEQIRQYRESAHVIEAHPYYLNFVPFGTGQFQNGQTVKGILLASGEALTGFTSFGIWFYLVNKYGINNSHPFTTNEAERVLLLQQIEVGTGIAFIVLAVYGVIDARLHWKPQVRGEFDDSLLPPELRRPKAEHAKPKKTSSLHLGPIVTPSGAGIGLSWEN